MENFAAAIDLFLYGLFAATCALILYKAVELRSTYGGFSPPPALSSLMDVEEQLIKREAGLALLSVIATGAAFLGLAGTVMHIMSALAQIKGSALDITLISGPIATALKSTLLGLASAIPAAVAHGLLTRRLDVLEMRMRRRLHDYRA